jgi:hypothetical protein
VQTQSCHMQLLQPMYKVLYQWQCISIRYCEEVEITKCFGSISH